MSTKKQSQVLNIVQLSAQDLYFLTFFILNFSNIKQNLY